MGTPRSVETYWNLFFMRPGLVLKILFVALLAMSIAFNNRLSKLKYNFLMPRGNLQVILVKNSQGFPTYIPPIRLQNQMNPPSSFPSPPILKSSPFAAVKWDLPKFDRKEIDFFTAAATLHHQGIPTTTETLKSSPYAEVNNTDHRSSQIDESPANYCLLTAPVTEGTAPNANELTF
ncbi:hypothetical protein OIU74_004921 [Salix koriyanagi]|uniref:Uncharacterized protein n=1 Tax=Salix koriyanagi TaxID=2511006 RepID=A0A9Q0ZG10_9ROSI|nr:hypothetical protein OIU74_004921 [Salix koriyanagi]